VVTQLSGYGLSHKGEINEAIALFWPANEEFCPPEHFIIFKKSTENVSSYFKESPQTVTKFFLTRNMKIIAGIAIITPAANL